MELKNPKEFWEDQMNSVEQKEQLKLEIEVLK